MVDERNRRHSLGQKVVDLFEVGDIVRGSSYKKDDEGYESLCRLFARKRRLSMQLIVDMARDHDLILWL